MMRTATRRIDKLEVRLGIAALSGLAQPWWSPAQVANLLSVTTPVWRFSANPGFYRTALSLASWICSEYHAG